MIHSKKKLKLVSIEEIPTTTENVNLDDLFKVYKLCTQLRTVCDANDGIGIAAVQCGIAQKLFLIKFPDGYGYFANCEYSPVDENDKFTSLEGCLSIKTPKGNLRMFEVPRFSKIVVSGFRILETKTGLELKELKDYSMDGLYSIVFQHEIQHQQGILISDIGKEVEIY